MAKNKILPLVVSFWIMIAVSWGQSRGRNPASELLSQAQKVQKESGDKAALDLLWKNSEKLQRPEYLFMALILTKQRNFKDVLKVSELALAKNSQDAEFLTFQGKAYLETQKDNKKLEKAQESLRAAIEINPKFEPAYLILDDYYERQDKLYLAQKKPQRFLQTRRLLYEDLIEHLGTKHLYLAKLCEINTLDGVNGQATTYCKRALELKKDDIPSQLHLAQVYIQTGEKEEALKILTLVTSGKSPSAQAYEAHGQFLEAEKNFSDAYIQYKACISRFQNADDCRRGLATSAVSLKKWDEAYASFQTLCRKSRKWSTSVRKASMTARDLGARDWEQKFLELSLNCNI